MLSFAVYSNGQPAEEVDLCGAYVVGTDDVPLRAEISFSKGVIHCQKRAGGPAGLALLWELPGLGRVMLETVRVPEREKPYILQVELARSRLMRINQKLEDWGMVDFDGAEEIDHKLQQSRKLLVQALQGDTPAQAASKGEEALAASVEASEQLTLHHADVFLDHRIQSNAFGRRVFGCSVEHAEPTEVIRRHLTDAFDFATVPITWREIEPKEQSFHWKKLDTWIETLTRLQLPMVGSALLSFDMKDLPDWLQVWEHDYDTIRDLSFEHMRRVINRYGQYIQTWTVVSGAHANNCFCFNFEQIMELTRMAAALTKQLAPRSFTLVELVAPWGEYYARNQRTIPPLLYADMTVQSGVNFDAFALQFHFGHPEIGTYMRDLFQISSQLDLFAKLGKPLHITAIEVPSITPESDANDRNAGSSNCGFWRAPWNEDIQFQWVQRFIEIALSKPCVETVSWKTLADHKGQSIPGGGLLREDFEPKAALEQIRKVRETIRAGN